MPEGAARAVRAFWNSGDPERRIAAARTLVHIDPESQFHRLLNSPPQWLSDLLVGPGTPGSSLFVAFEPRDIAVQKRALELVDIGLGPEDALARAEELVARDTLSERRATPLSSGLSKPEGGRTGDVGGNSVSREKPVAGDGHSANSDGGQPRGKHMTESASDVPAQLVQEPGGDNPLRLPPEEEIEARSNFERIQTDGVQGLDRRQKINVLKSLWRGTGDPTDDEGKVVGEIYRTMPLDKAFMELDAAKRAEFLEKFKNDPVIQSVDPRRWSGLSHEQKLAIFNRVVELQAKVYGYPEPKVELRGLGREAAAGVFDERTETVVINPQRSDFTDQMPVTLGTVAHEALHAYQWKLKQDFAAGKIPPSDPRYQAAELFTLNSGILSFPGVAGQIYFDQPSERHSHTMKTAVQNMITENLNRRVRGAERP